jgi:Ser-tRNA(Ala) deacylase AlaX
MFIFATMETSTNIDNKSKFQDDALASMHTAEHILTGTIVKMFGTKRAFTTHIERKKSKIDIHFDRNLTAEEIAEVEKQVNDVIASNAPVTAENLPKEEAMKSFDLGRIPDPETKFVRIVSVGDYDACPCIGTHVENTSAIPPIKIISTDNNDGVLRIRFKFAK